MELWLDVNGERKQGARAGHHTTQPASSLDRSGQCASASQLDRQPDREPAKEPASQLVIQLAKQLASQLAS
jgi:hypothetical protein